MMITFLLGIKLALLDTLRLHLPEGFELRQASACGTDTLFGVVDSSGKKFLALWASDGSLLRLEPAPFCCGFLAYAEGKLVVSDPYSAFFWVNGEEKFLKTRCAPSRLSVAYKKVFPVGDSFLVVGKYGEGDTRALVSLWDSGGHFARALVEARGAWAAPRPFATSPVFATLNGDTLAVASEYSGEVFLLSLKERKLLRTVRPSGIAFFGEPDSAQGWDYDSFGLYLDAQCGAGRRVLRAAVPLGRYLFLYTATCRKLRAERYLFSAEPKAYLYDLKKGSIVWEGEAGFPAGVLREDTLLLKPRSLSEFLRGKLVKALVSSD